MSSKLRDELLGSGSIEITRNGIRAVRMFKVRWLNRNYASDPLGTPYSWDSNAILTGVRFDPIPGDIGHVAPGGGAEMEDGAYYEWCRLTQTYESAPTENLPVFSYRLGGEALEIGIGRKWSDGTVSSQSQIAYIPTGEILARIIVSDTNFNTNWALIWAGSSHVNNATWRNFPAGCVLFNNVEADEKWDIIGGQTVKVWALTYSFLFKTTNFNEFPRSDKDYDLWHYETDIYPGYDFSLLGLGT